MSSGSYDARLGLADVVDDGPEHGRPAPGKVTLTASLPPRRRDRSGLDPLADGVGALITQVQLHGGDATEPDCVHAAARRGLATPVTSLPFRGELERAFGPTHDLTAIRAHVGSEAESSARSMGADAYATGADIVLPSSPSLRLVAHEVTHTIQQSGGVQLSGGVGQVGDRYEREADDIAERVVSGERVGHLLAPRSMTESNSAIQRQAAPPAPATVPPGGGAGDGIDTKTDLNIPHRDYVIEISNDGQGRFVFAGQIKVALKAPIASASAKGAIDGGAAGDHDAQAKLDLLNVQQKGMFRPHEVAGNGKRLVERMSVSLAKPGANLDVFPGVSVDVTGDLGQFNLSNGQLSIGSVNFSVKGDVTRWVLGDDAKRAGFKAELIAQIKVKLLPGDLKNLVAMARNTRQLQKAEEAARMLRDALMRDKAKLSRIELGLARASRQGARGAELATKLRGDLVKVRASIGARLKALKAVRSQVKALWSGLRAGANKLAAKGAQIVGKQILDTGSKLVAGVLRVISHAFLLFDLAEIGFAVYRILDGTAEAKLGGGGPGGLLKKGVPGGTVPDGNSETEGAPDATGTGTGTGDDAELAPDAGNSPDIDGDGGASNADGDGNGASRDEGVALDDGAGDDFGTPLVEDAGTTGDDGQDAGDAADDDGGLGTAVPQKPDGGPGAGATTGSAPSVSTQAGGGAVDRNAPADQPPGPPPLASPADTTGAAAHDGTVATNDTSGSNTSSSDEPSELVTNANALRIMSALDALGQPATPEIVALIETLIPTDLTQDEVDALIDEMMLWLVPGDQATDATTIEGVTEAVSAFLHHRAQKRNGHAKGAGTGGSGGGGGTTGTGSGGGGATDASGSSIGGGARGASNGGEPAAKGSTRGTDAKNAAKPGAKKNGADHGRVVLKGKGLTPTVFEDGALALSQEQAGKWLKEDVDTVVMSNAGKAWRDAHRNLVVKTKPAAKITDVRVAGSSTGVDTFDVVISFAFKQGNEETLKTVSFTWKPRAPKGKQAQVPHTVTLEPLERLVTLHAFTANIQTNVPVDLGPFTIKVVEVHNAPYTDGTTDTPLSFLLTVEIVEVRDTALATFRGHDVKVGTRITESFGLRPRAP